MIICADLRLDTSPKSLRFIKLPHCIFVSVQKQGSLQYCGGGEEVVLSGFLSLQYFNSQQCNISLRFWISENILFCILWLKWYNYSKLIVCHHCNTFFSHVCLSFTLAAWKKKSFKKYFEKSGLASGILIPHLTMTTTCQKFIYDPKHATPFSLDCVQKEAFLWIRRNFLLLLSPFSLSRSCLRIAVYLHLDEQ